MRFASKNDFQIAIEIIKKKRLAPDEIRKKNIAQKRCTKLQFPKILNIYYLKKYCETN